MARRSMLRFMLFVLVTFISLWTAGAELLRWPAGSYGLPKADTGCPVESGLSWKTGILYQDCEDTMPATSASKSLHLQGFIKQGDVQRAFCIKDPKSSDVQRPPWPAGEYCIYQKVLQCPAGLRSGCVTWDDEDSPNNKNWFVGTMPRGHYSFDTTICFCCSTEGYWFQPISLPVASPFYLIAFGGKYCQKVHGARDTLEYIHYDTEYGTFTTANDYWGAHPHGVSKTHSGHTIYYCYYEPRYCPQFASQPSNGRVVPERCTVKDANKLNDTCSVTCDPGFTHEDTSAQTAQCTFTGMWNRSRLTDCVPFNTTTPVPGTIQPNGTHYANGTQSTNVTQPTTGTNVTEPYPGTSPSPTPPSTSSDPTGFTTLMNHTTTSSTTPAGTEGNASGSAQTTRTSNQSSPATTPYGQQSTLGRSQTSDVTRVTPGSAAVYDGDWLASEHVVWLSSGCAGFVAVLLLVFLLRWRRRKIARKDITVRMSSLQKSDSLENFSSQSFAFGRVSVTENVLYSDLLFQEAEEYEMKCQDNVLYESFTPFALTRSSSNVLYESVSPFEAVISNYVEEEPVYMNYKSLV